MRQYGINNCDRSNRMRFPFRGYQILIIIMLFMMSLNIVNRFYYAAFLVFVVLVTMKRNELCVPSILIPVFLFSVSLSVFSPASSGSVLSFLKQYTYPMCVIVGYNLVSSNKADIAQKQVNFITIALASGACCHYFLNMLKNIGETGGRNTIDIWTNTVIAATGQAALACMMIAVTAAFLFSRSTIKVRLCMFTILLGIIYYNLTLAGRTLFVLLAVAFVIAFVAKIVMLHNFVKRIRLIVAAGAVLLVTIAIVSTNTFGVKDTIIQSNFYNRFFQKNAAEDISEDSRFERKIQFIERLDEHLWGGNNIKAEIGFAHDIILDTYDEAGVFAMLFILIFLVDMIRKGYVLCRARKVDEQTKIMILCLMSVVMMEFMIEPILAGMPWLLANCCVIYGAYSRLAGLI